MLLHTEGNRIFAYNPSISKKDAKVYIDSGEGVWIEGIEINEPRISENQIVEMYLLEDNSVDYSIIDIPQEPETRHEKLTKAVKTEASIISEDGLINMDMLIALDEKLNIMLEHLGL